MGHLQSLLLHLAALALLLVCVGPIALSLFASVMPDQAIFGFPPDWFGHDPTLDNYLYIFTGAIPDVYLTAGANRGMISDAARQVPGGMWNSTLVALGVMAVNIGLGGPAAYAFARLRFRGQTASFLAIILSRLVPAVALVTPFYLIVQAMGLLGTRSALILVHSVLTLPFTVLILTVFFRRIPREIEESAMLDGCGRLEAFRYVFLPLARTSIVATGLFAFVLSYAEFLFGLVLSGDAESRPLSVVLAALARNTDVSWGLLNASVVLAVIPTVALAALVWRFVVEGLLEGGVET
jgi:ABC-type glycerol-3-phosphate transport system permease component